MVGGRWFIGACKALTAETGQFISCLSDQVTCEHFHSDRLIAECTFALKIWSTLVYDAVLASLKGQNFTFSSKSNRSMHVYTRKQGRCRLDKSHK